MHVFLISTVPVSSWLLSKEVSIFTIGSHVFSSVSVNEGKYKTLIWKNWLKKSHVYLYQLYIMTKHQLQMRRTESKFPNKCYSLMYHLPRWKCLPRHFEIVPSANNEIFHFHNHSRKCLQSMPVKTALWHNFNAVRPTVLVAMGTLIFFSWQDSVPSTEGSAESACALFWWVLLAPVCCSAPLGAGVRATCSCCW